MKRLLFLTTCLIMLASCKPKPILVATHFNSLSYSDTCILIDSTLDNAIKTPNERTIVYFLNAGCSICNADFIEFIRTCDDYAFDSLLVIASGVYDFIQTEYFLNRVNLELPYNARLIIDSQDTISDKMLETYGYQDIFLLEQKRILMYYHTQGFIRNEELGYCLDAQVFKQTVN